MARINPRQLNFSKMMLDKHPIDTRGVGVACGEGPLTSLQEERAVSLIEATLASPAPIFNIPLQFRETFKVT